MAAGGIGRGVWMRAFPGADFGTQCPDDSRLHLYAEGSCSNGALGDLSRAGGMAAPKLRWSADAGCLLEVFGDGGLLLGGTRLVAGLVEARGAGRKRSGTEISNSPGGVVSLGLGGQHRGAFLGGNPPAPRWHR